MAILDFLLGDSSLKRQRDKAIDYARDAYDPSVFQPAVNQAATTAAEGIGQERRDIMRARTVQSLFTPTDSATFRGNQASQLAGQQAQTQARQQALAGFESNLAEADIQTQRQGEQRVAGLQTQQKQTQAQQEAAIDEAELHYEAERSRRKQALQGAALGLVGNLVTTPFGAVEAVEEIRDEEGNLIQEGTEGKPARSLVQRGLGALFGGDDSEQVAGSAMGISDQANLFGMLDGISNIPEQSGGMGISDQANLFGMLDGISNIPEQSGGMGISDQANLFGMLDGISNIPEQQQQSTQGLADDIIPSREGIMSNVPQQTPEGTPLENLTQELISLENKEDLTFEEFSRLQELQQRRPADVSLDVQRRMREDYEQNFLSGKGFSNVGSNISRNIQGLFDFLNPPLEEQYRQYQNR